MRIAVLFGGTSDERDVSIASAAQIIPALRTLGHDVFSVDTAIGRLSPPEELKLLATGVTPEPPSSDKFANVRGRAISVSPTASAEAQFTYVEHLSISGTGISPSSKCAPLGLRASSLSPVS